MQLTLSPSMDPRCELSVVLLFANSKSEFSSVVDKSRKIQNLMSMRLFGWISAYVSTSKTQKTSQILNTKVLLHQIGVVFGS